MENIDKFCVLSYDEMIISEQLDYDKSSGKHVGNVTLGEDKDLVGQKLYIVVVRGVKNRWKQIIACHVTRKESIHAERLKEFMLDCISYLEACGFFVVSLDSDLDSRNRSLWTSLGISITKYGKRQNYFTFNNHEIYAMPDGCHLLKNLKSAVLRQKIQLPASYIEQENLPTDIVDGLYIKTLWDFEMSNNQDVRLLHHIKKDEIEPSNFDKMDVGAAVRFFSSKTASALKTAVDNDILPKEALTTAAFILVVEEWFSVTASRERKTLITSRNCDRKYIFLHFVIDLFQNSIFDKGWKPLNFGFVLNTLSFCDMAEFLFKNGFDFILGHRFTQDVTENIVSQIRNKEGKMPTSLQALRAIKSISVSQYISDVKNTSYLDDSDTFLLDFCHEKKKRKLNIQSKLVVDVVTATKENVQIRTQNFCLADFSEMISQYDANGIFYLAGSTTNSVVKHVCNNCVEFLFSKNLPTNIFIKKARRYTLTANKGGLKEPSLKTLIINYFKFHKKMI